MVEFNEGDNIRVQLPDGWHVVTVKDVIPDPDGFGATLTFSHVDGEPVPVPGPD